MGSTLIAPTGDAEFHELNRLLTLGTPALVSADGRQRIPLPPTVYEILKEVVSHLQLDHGITIVPEHHHLSTQRAAEILGVSRPFLVKLIVSGEIPFTRIGSHRRLLLRDVLAYQTRRDAARREGPPRDGARGD